MSTPSDITQKQDWNHFWSLESRKKQKAISWSKKRILQLVSRYLQKDMSILDAGCGTGFFSNYFCEQGYETVALDYSEEALAITKKRTHGRVKILKADMLSEGLEQVTDDRFDLIFSDGLFEHFSKNNQDRIMNNLKSVLSVGGIVATFVPNRWSPWELIRPFMMPGIKEEPFVLKRLKDLNERNGLKVIHSGGINVVPFALSPEALLGKYFGMLLFSAARR